MAYVPKALQATLQKNEVSYLKKIGLSKAAIRLYADLLQAGGLSAQEAAALHGSFASAQYRLFYELERRELVRCLAGRPKRFEALPVGDGLQASLVKQEKTLEQLITGRLGSDTETMHILVGRQEVYDAYMYYARQAKKQICLYAIGIAYSKELAATQKAVVKRGVLIRHVVQEVKAANYYVISRWLKLGIELRTLKRPRGYHLTIIDDSCAIVTFSNPRNTDQRMSLLTTNPDIIAILQTQFEPIWRAARVIPPELLG